MHTETEKMVSAVKVVTAPDGSTFGMLRWAGENAGKIRGEALVEMRRLVGAQEPESLQYLATSPGVSAEYAMSSAIQHVKSLALKADLVRVAVQRELAEGSHNGAIRMLEYSNAAQLDLPEYGEQFVVDQYNAAMSESDFLAAYMLAGTMADKGRKAVRARSKPKDARDTGIEDWREKKETAFGLYAQQLLTAYREGAIPADNWKFRSLFDAYRFRPDGYEGQQIHPLATEVAKVVVNAALEQGDEWGALQDALIAKLPDAFVRELRKKVSPTAVDKLEMWVIDLRERISRIFAK